jgi:hypothetical protein
MTQSTGKHPSPPQRAAKAAAPSRVLLAPVPAAGPAASRPARKPRPGLPLDRIASEVELVELIHARLRPASSRRVGLPHAAMLRTLDRMEGGAGDVHAIYKALLDNGQTMVMSKVYRVLKVLEEAGLVERRWLLHDGRPRSEYRIVRA